MNKIYLDPEIYYIENFIEKEHCNYIYSFLNSKNDWREHGSFYQKNEQSYPENINEILDFYRLKVENLINDENNLVNFTKLLQKYIVSKEDWAIAPHADRFDSGSNEYNSLNSKNVTKGYILYFNDNYEGGEVVYVNKNVEIKPKSGMILVHSGFEDYKHGVKAVTSGERYILSGFVYEKNYFLNNIESKNPN